LAFPLSGVRVTVAVQSLCKIRVQQRRFSMTITLSFHEYAPFSARTHTYSVRLRQSHQLGCCWKDGSRLSRPRQLFGSEQARRHRAMCNRGHGLLLRCVEVQMQHYYCTLGLPRATRAVARDRWPPAQTAASQIDTRPP